MTHSAILIRGETPADHAVIAHLNDAAFGNDDGSALTAKLRADGLIFRSLVATRDANIIGHIALSPLPTEIDGRAVRALALAPLAVAPEHQRSGVGAALTRAALATARAEGWEAIIVLGHADYYPRFGFSAALAAKLDAPFSGPSFMALELRDGALAGARGKVDYPSAFGIEPGSH